MMVRNEESLLLDTLIHLKGFADFIVANDDASTDRTATILKNEPKVVYLIENRDWSSERLQFQIDARNQLLNSDLPPKNRSRCYVRDSGP
jgi:hypothetical protein